MKFILILAVSVFSISAYSQDSLKTTKSRKMNPRPEPPVFVTVPDTPAYQKNPHIPPFSLLLSDSSFFYNYNIAKGKPTVIVYFSPDCSHCQADAKNLMEKLDSLTEINFVWCSSHDPEKIKEFAVKYHMANLPNMVFGKDVKYAIPSFYKVQFTPYFVVYGKDGLFYKEFRNGLLPYDLIAAVEESNMKKKKR